VSLTEGIDWLKLRIIIHLNKEKLLMKLKAFLLLMVMIGIVVSLLACTAPDVSSEPTEPISPITIGDDLTSIDVCEAIPPEDIEAIMLVKLAEPPTPYTYRYTEGTSGCYYEGSYDNTTPDVQFAYVVLTPLEAYDNQTLYQNEDVSGIGDQAYFNGASDKRELWVKIDNKVAFVVSFGDIPKEEGAKAIARLMVEAIQ
jgi:hypothetical protein